MSLALYLTSDKVNQLEWYSLFFTFTTGFRAEIGFILALISSKSFLSLAVKAFLKKSMKL